MLQLQLFIEGQQIELYKDESITLTQSIQDIKDISKIFTDFTRTFSVPASKNNNKIFKHFYNFHIRTFNDSTGEYEFYDARKKKESKLLLNYKPFKEGKVKFEGVTLKNNEPHTYKLTFFGNTVNLKDVLGEDKLANLSQLSLFDFQYNDANIKTYMSNGLDVNFFGGTIEDAIIFPLITHTSRIIYDNTKANDVTNKIYNIDTTAGTSSSYGLPKSELKPAIRLYAVIKAIENEAQYNLKFSEDFFSKTNLDFYNLYLWLHNKEGALFQNQDAQYQITGFTNITQPKGTAGSIQGVTNKTFVNNYNEDSFNRFLRVTVRPSGNAAYNLVIKKDGENFKRFDNLTGTTTNGVVSSNFKDKDHNIEIPSGTYTYFIETLAVSTYSVDFSIEQHRAKGTKQKQIITVLNAVAEYSASDKPANITALVPDIKIIDFITGIFKMFNLTAFQNTDGTLVIQPLDEFFNASTQVWDITKHLDKTQNTVESILPFKEIVFRYTGTDSFLANNYKELSGKEWGRLDFADDKYNGKLYKVELPFEHFQYEHLYVTDNGVVQTITNSAGNQENKNSQVQYGYSVDKDQQPYLGEPLIFYASTSISTIAVLTLDLATRETVSGAYIPLNSNGILNVFGSSAFQNLNFNAEYDEYSRQVNTKTLFHSYYKEYVEDMFDKRKRLTTVKAYLPMEVTIKLNLADKIIVFDDIFRINKITTNFETNLSTLELNNIFEEVNFNTYVTVAQNGITVDTNLLRASNGSIKASSGSNTQFTIPSTQTVIPNTVPLNNPVPIYSNVPLTVTAPTIADYNATVSTTTSVFFNHQITAMGKLNNTSQVDEYGFLYSTTKSNLTGSDDVDDLKATGGVSVVPYTATQFLTVPKIVNYEKSGLSHPATYYWRFYARTNTDPAHGTADAISDCKTVSTVASAVSQYNNANGENLVGVAGSTGYLTDTTPLGFSKSNFQNYGAENQEGFIIRHTYNLTVDTAKEIIEWLTSQASPSVDTYYDISHTFKALDRFGANNSTMFNMTDKTNAKVKYHMFLNAYPVVMIKGGTVTGTLATGGTYSIGDGNGDLQSTS
jgi:hypothetical protein